MWHLRVRWLGLLLTSIAALGCEGKAALPLPKGPYLATLSVSGTGSSPPMTLVPQFSPTVYDYYVRCAAGANAVTVSMMAVPGATSRLTQPTPSDSAPQQTFSLDVNENQAIVATASLGTATTEYWVRCLPQDMPELTWTPHPGVGTPSPGYYLTGNWFQPPTGTGGYALVLNSDGVPVWYKRMPTGFGMSDLDTLAPGSLSYFPMDNLGLGAFVTQTLSPPTMSTLAPAGDEDVLSNHELRLLPNGNYLVFYDPLKYGVDLTGLTIDGVTLGQDSIIEDCEILEFTSAGTLVSTWRASDHFDTVKDSPFAGLTSPAPDGGTVVDAFHCNSIDIDPANTNLLVSARQMDSIFYIQRSTGVVLWKMGGTTYSKDNASYVAVPNPFFAQHDARLLPGWSQTCTGARGQISLYDDETATNTPARAVLYDVDIGEQDGGALVDGGCGDGGAAEARTTGVATLVWQYQGSEEITLGGSFRISADGSHVIGWGWESGGASALLFTEVDLNGNDLLDVGFADTESAYRVVKIPLTAFDLNVLRSTAGQ